MSEILYRYSTIEDIAPLTRLWCEVFGDSEELVAGYFRLLWTPESCIAAELDGELCAMGHCLLGPRAAGLDCGYIYAMATAPEHRGLGIAAGLGRRLIEGAFRAGAQIVATLPADEGLCAWYESRLGMRPLFRKGGAGVSFPQVWQDFAALCGAHSDDTSDRLWAIARPGTDISHLHGLGWEHTFD